MKKILWIGTGGTIASEMSEDGFRPGLTSEQLMKYVPGLAGKCAIDCVQPFNLDSTNIGPEHWLRMASIVRESYDLYDGFVITHGTDTMAYTAAALSYLIQGPGKPVVLTGAQKPIGSEITDSRKNLYDAFCCASGDEISGVVLVFNGKVILGTRARKTRTKSFEAFESINYPEIAAVDDWRITCYIGESRVDRPVFYDKLGREVLLLKLIPGMPEDALAWMLDNSDVLVVESFGVGGLPDGMRRLINGRYRCGTVIMTTQVQNEGSDISVYSVGSSLKSSGAVLETFDMTTEAVCAKAMWILGQTRDRAEMERLFFTEIRKDILRRR